MKFGTLQITTPDGRAYDYPLDRPNIALGRAPGNDLVIDDTSVSRRHARLTVESGRLLIEDLGSANGTYIDHQRLVPNASNIVPDDEAICLGDVEIRFIPPPPIEVSPRRETSVVAPESGGPPLAVSLVWPGQPVAPGSAVMATLTVQNRSTVVDELIISVSGVPLEWVRLSKERVPLLPNAQETLTFTFVPPRRSEAVATEYAFIVSVTSREQRTSVSKSGTLKVLPFQAFSLSLEPSRSRGNYQLLVRNDGNTPVTYRFRGHDDEQALIYQFNQAAASFQPGQSGVIGLQVRPKIKPRIGSRETRAFNLIAAPLDPVGAEAKTTGQLIIRPPIPFWLMSLLVVVALALCAVAAFAYGQICGVLGRNLPLCPAGAKPTIIFFTVTPIEVQVGETVAIQWDVTNAEKVELIAPFQDALPGKSGVKTYTVAQSTNFTLKATNFAGSDEKTVIVKVKGNVPVIQSFTADPPLVTSQVKQVTLSWIVAGADAVSIGGVSGANSAATGSVSIAPPTTDKTYVLIATNATGTVSRTLTLPVRAAACSTGRVASLRFGPSDKYESIAELPANTSLLPNGRNNPAEWLHVQIPQLQKEGWVAVTDIMCSDLDVLSLDIIPPGEYPPVPTDTPGPVAVPALAGLSADQAAVELNAVGLIAGATVSEQTDAVSQGKVIRTEPAAGMQVTRATRITLYVSSGPTDISVPATIVGMPANSAIAELSASGLAAGASQSEPSNTIAAGLIIRSDPSPGTRVPRGTSITLYVSSGPSPVTVPDVCNLSVDVATTKLQVAGLTVGSTTTEINSTVGKGRVIRTQPAANATVSWGAPIDLFVSLGRACLTRQDSVTPEPIPLMPTLKRGDKEFDGNGPVVVVKVTLEQSDNSIWVNVYMKAEESAGGHTKDSLAEGETTREVYRAPAGWRIKTAIPSDVYHVEYYDTNDDLDVFTPNGRFVTKLEIMGDGPGDDIEVHTGVTAYFATIYVDLIESIECVP